jgi:hypothetical protein
MSYSFYDSLFAIHLQYMHKENSLLRLNKHQKASLSLFKSLKIQILLDRTALLRITHLEKAYTIC